MLQLSVLSFWTQHIYTEREREREIESERERQGTHRTLVNLLEPYISLPEPQTTKPKLQAL